jgi:hypothetical protein
MQHPSTCFAAQGKANQLEGFTQSRSPTRIGGDDARQALPEDPTRAGSSRTDEAPHGELNGDGDAMPGEIGQRADIAAVDPGGGAATERAGGAGGCCGHEDGDGGTVDTEQIETKTRGIRKEGGRHGADP